MTTPIKHALVTGGSGFIGTHLIRMLLADAGIERITVLDLLPPQVSDPRVTYIAADLRTPLDERLTIPADVCFHLAALCKEPKYHWDDYFVTNHIGTRNLCEFLAKEGVPKVIFTSTMMVYRAGEHRYLETDCAAPDTAYGISKLLAEAELHKWAGAGRVLQIVRPGVVFGQGENGNFTRLYEALKRGRFAYVGRSCTRKACIYVKDCCGFLLHLAASPEAFGIYNAALPRTLTVREICETFCDVFHLNRRIPTVPFRLALLAGYCGDLANSAGIRTNLHHRRIEKLYYSTDIATEAMLSTGFRPAYGVAEGLLEWGAESAPGSLS